MLLLLFLANEFYRLRNLPENRPYSLLRLWRNINHLLTYLLTY